jgi:hypothetical protein
MVLSLAPGSLRPHTGLPGQMEHALAYGLRGAILCVGYGKPRDRLLLWIGLAACRQPRGNAGPDAANAALTGPRASRQSQCRPEGPLCLLRRDFSVRIRTF